MKNESRSMKSILWQDGGYQVISICKYSAVHENSREYDKMSSLARNLAASANIQEYICNVRQLSTKTFSSQVTRLQLP